VDRAFDWGSARPYSVGWWAESDGTDAVMPDGTRFPTRKGDLFLIGELYGWNGTANEGTRELASEVARKIRISEAEFGHKVLPGPADSAIYAVDNGNCIADDMARSGVTWVPANKSSGSRANGWELMRDMLKAVFDGSDRPRMFIFHTCRQFIRTVPVLPRDERKPDDVATETEDHIADMTRYRVLALRHTTKVEAV
jgi:hypothetical protein